MGGGVVSLSYSALSHRGAAMVEKTWLNLAAERGIALATWGLYPTIVVREKHAMDREAVAGRRLRQLAAKALGKLKMRIRELWKNGRNRFKELRRRGVSKFNAPVATGSPTGFWRMSGHVAVQQALRNHYFDSIGLPRLVVSSDA